MELHVRLMYILLAILFTLLIITICHFHRENEGIKTMLGYMASRKELEAYANMNMLSKNVVHEEEIIVDEEEYDDEYEEEKDNNKSSRYSDLPI